MIFGNEIIGTKNLTVSNPIPLKVIGSLIAGGFQNPADDHFKEAVDLASIIVTNESSTFMGTAWSSSMEPLIYPGSTLIVDKSQEVRNGHYIAGTYDNEWFMKRLWREKDGSIMLHSENPNHKAHKVCEGIQFRIFGRITHVIMAL